MNQPSEVIKIVRIKRGSFTASVKVNSLDAPLVLPLSMIEAEMLKENMTISAEQLDRLRAESELLQCDSKAAGMLSRRDYSVGEFKRRLRLKSFSEKTIEDITTKYKKKRLLNDRQYSEKLVEYLLREKPCGKSFLIAALRKKMIHRSLAEETVQAIYNDEDSSNLAVDALNKRWWRFSQFELEEARVKAYNYLSGRGFGYSAAKEAFEKLWNQQNEERSD